MYLRPGNLQIRHLPRVDLDLGWEVFGLRRQHRGQARWISQVEVWSWELVTHSTSLKEDGCDGDSEAVDFGGKGIMNRWRKCQSKRCGLVTARTVAATERAQGNMKSYDWRPDWLPEKAAFGCT